MDNRLMEIKARCDAATPGAWIALIMTSKKSRRFGGVFWKVVEARNNLDQMCHYIPTKSDAEFIAHAREDIPYLLEWCTALVDRVEHLEAENKRLHTILNTTDCDTCKHNGQDCPDAEYGCNWEWNGV